MIDVLNNQLGYDIKLDLEKNDKDKKKFENLVLCCENIKKSLSIQDNMSICRYDVFQDNSNVDLIIDNFTREQFENLIKDKALASLNLARKAGVLVTGFEKVKEVIQKDKVDFIIEARDAGQDGKEKIAFLAKNLEKFNLFSIDELDRALNKENTVHIAVLKSDMSRSVYDNLKKYQNFLNGENNE